MKEGCKDTLVVLLHSDAPLATRARAQADKLQRKASGASLRGSSSLTQWLWDRMRLHGVEVNRMLQLSAAADEVRLLKGSCEQGSNDGTKVKTILCRSHDI